MSAFKVLISPLDWGLGHATRCVPIIRFLLDKGVQVFIAGSGASLQLLKMEFPNLIFLNLPSFEINYGSHFAFAIIKQLPQFLTLIKKEQKCVNAWNKQYKFDLIISDNRYGFRSSEVRSVFVSHQLSPRLPYIPKVIALPIQNKLNAWMNTFSEIWVPDFEGENNLSGLLSKNDKLKLPVKFIGPLSRFDSKESANTNNDVLVVISGPEPARTKFEEIIVKKLLQQKKSATIVRGLLKANKVPFYRSNITVFNHLPSEKLNELMANSNLIISRAGYSTIMDLFHLNKRAILIPTPGQYEQEYLANYLSKYSCWEFCDENTIIISNKQQDDFSLPKDLISNQIKLYSVIEKLIN